MSTFLELASEANGFATSRPVTAASIPRRDYPLPRVSRSWDMRGFLGTRDRASCAIEALARMSFSKKAREVGIQFLKSRVTGVVGSKLPAFPGF